MTRLLNALICLALSSVALAQVPPPTGLTVTRQPGGTCAILTWTDVARNEESYEVRRFDPVNPPITVVTLPANSTTYTDCSLDTAQPTYSYWIHSTPKRGPGVTFGLDANALFFEVETSQPTVTHVWGNRLGGLPVSGYCVRHVSTGPEDAIYWDCYYPLTNKELHYQLRACDTTRCLGWDQEPHLRCSPVLIAGAGCRCNVLPSDPGCIAP